MIFFKPLKNQMLKKMKYNQITTKNNKKLRNKIAKKIRKFKNNNQKKRNKILQKKDIKFIKRKI